MTWNNLQWPEISYIDKSELLRLWQYNSFSNPWTQMPTNKPPTPPPPLFSPCLNRDDIPFPTPLHFSLVNLDYCVIACQLKVEAKIQINPGIITGMKYGMNKTKAEKRCYQQDSYSLWKVFDSLGNIIGHFQGFESLWKMNNLVVVFESLLIFTSVRWKNQWFPDFETN